MKKTTLRIRRAELSDADALRSCIDAAYARYVDRIADLPPVSDGCAKEIARNQVWVADAGGEIVGGLFLIAGEDFIKLANLAVHPDHGGKGIGRTLIECGEREARRQGYDEMRLNTHVDMPENVQLYSHFGWEEISRGGTTVTMRRRLSDA